MPVSIDPLPSDDEIECGRCGATTFHELTRCRKCGGNLYEPDDRVDQDHQEGSIFVTHQHMEFFSRQNGYLRKLKKRIYPVDDLYGAAINQAVVHNDLLGKMGGDHSAVERLINFENQQLSGGTRLTWIENAIRRWEQGNRSTTIG